jgi:hypothetical protein
VCEGSSAFGVTVSTVALPPPAAASNDAMRIVATIFVSAAISTVVIALPA